MKAQGFGDFTPQSHESWAERSLEKSSRELRALRKIIEKHKDDPKGRAKMMKKMKKYWRSNLAEVQGMDSKPMEKQAHAGGFVPVGMLEDLEFLQKSVGIEEDVEDPRAEEEALQNSIDSLKEEDMSRIRDMLSKQDEETANDQPAPDV
jgi:hypothetical protein